MKEQQVKFNGLVIVGAVLFILNGIIPAHADLKEIKKYKEAFPEAKPKCIECHVQEKPKKDDGQHELNEYGNAVKAKAEEITAETYKAVGKIEDFKPEAK